MLLKDHSIDARATTSVAYKISKNMARTCLYARNGPILQITVKRLKITAFQLFVRAEVYNHPRYYRKPIKKKQYLCCCTI